MAVAVSKWGAARARQDRTEDDIMVLAGDGELRLTVSHAVETTLGCKVCVVASARSAVRALDRMIPGVLILDTGLDCIVDVVAVARRARPAIGLIGLELGHHDTRDLEDLVGPLHAYLSPPFSSERLLGAARRCFERLRRTLELEHHRHSIIGADLSDPLLGSGRHAHGLRERLVQITGLTNARGTSPPILIQGETGTGKRSLARRLHTMSDRLGDAFVEIRCGRVAAGHEPGTLLGIELACAGRTQPGLAAAATGGTLVLDEVAALPFDAQESLLTYIDTVDPAARNPVVVAALTVIATTSVPLSDLAASGRFSEPLHRRLDVVRIELPAFRLRGTERREIAMSLLQSICVARGDEPPRLSASAFAAVETYAWPGNLRELRWVLERAIQAKPGGTLDACDLIPPGIAAVAPGKQAAALYFEDDARRRLNLARTEIALIREAMALTGGTRSRAAELLGISRFQLRSRISKHGIDCFETEDTPS